MESTSRFADRPLATGTRQLETERVIVTEWRFPPGTRTGWHRHNYDYVIVPMTTSEYVIDMGEESTVSQMVTGQTYAREAGAEHDVINDTLSESVFIEIELKP